MTVKKGIILAAGKATRLQPATLVFGKPLLPLYDKPMVYYPITQMIEAGIRDILIITSPRDRQLFQAMLGDGAQWGVSISLQEQPVTRGIADAFLIGESFAGKDPVCLILGDNFFYGEGFDRLMTEAGDNVEGATIFCTYVENPRAFGVATLDQAGKVLELVEKPVTPASNWAATGLYFYTAGAADMAKTLTPSKRGELEITDLNIKYMEQGKLNAITLPRDFVWFDVGDHDSLLRAATLIQAEEKRLGRKIGCPDAAAYAMKFINREQLLKNAEQIQNPSYAAYLKTLAS